MRYCEYFADMVRPIQPVAPQQVVPQPVAPQQVVPQPVSLQPIPAPQSTPILTPAKAAVANSQGIPSAITTANAISALQANNPQAQQVSPSQQQQAQAIAQQQQAQAIAQQQQALQQTQQLAQQQLTANITADQAQAAERIKIANEIKAKEPRWKSGYFILVIFFIAFLIIIILSYSLYKCHHPGGGAKDAGGDNSAPATDGQ
jgi:ATP-dependent Zn protease